MRRAALLPLAALLALTLVAAASYTDTTAADFNAGDTSQVNTSNNAVELPLISGGYNSSGTFTSQVFSLGSNPSASIAWNFNTPSGTSLLISTRSGSNDTVFTGWSGWSASYALSTGSTITSPLGAFYQYRAQLVTTDNTTTPGLTDVTITYSEQGTNITPYTSSNTNLTSNSSGNFNYYWNASDTLSVTNVTARYRIDTNTSTGTWSSLTSYTPVATQVYNLTVPEPASGWDSLTNATGVGRVTFEIAVTTSNGSTSSTTNGTLNETIDFVNSAPTIDPITNLTVQQDATMNFTVSGGDTDNQSLTFTTNASYVTVTSLTSTSALLTWSPNSSQIGLHTILVYLNDTQTTSTAIFTVNVTDVNDAPVFDTIDDITGYHGIRQTLTLTATDADSNANISFSVSPSFFSIATTTNINGSAAASGTYWGFANFTPADDEDGVHNLTFTVTDGYDSATATALMTIDYCGDLTCQTDYESSDTCPQDCADVSVLDAASLVVPSRNCVGDVMTAYVFNATNRYSCYYEGLVEGGLALCIPLEGAAVTVYYRNGTGLTEKESLSSGANGSVSFTPAAAGEYKLTAKADGFSNTSSLVMVRDCSDDIVVVEQNVTVEQPAAPNATEKPQQTPQEEEPGIPQESASLLSILLFYLVIPVLLATLAYTSFVFYDVNKDTLPWILEARIFLYEQRAKYAPTANTYVRKIIPYLKPIGDALEAVYVQGLKPLIQPLLDQLKPRRPKQ